MRFIDETDCKLSVSNGSVNVLSICKMKTIFLLTLILLPRLPIAG